MDWPATPVEYWSDFRPPFCPWRGCAEHLRRDAGYRFHKHASYSTQRRKRVPRFRCLACKKTFSRQTFSVTYYRKRPELLRQVAAGIVGGSALRQIARTLECSPTTVGRISAHLGRHAILLHAESLKAMHGRLGEPVVLDHFETFEFTQDYPLESPPPSGPDRGLSTAWIPRRMAAPGGDHPHSNDACTRDPSGRPGVATPARHEESSICC